MTPSKARRITPAQQKMLLQFMQENSDFAARRAYDNKWEELAIMLNNGGEGSQKSVAEWRKVGETPPLVATSLPQRNLTWSDWRKNVRLKASGGKDREGTGRERARILSSVERRLLDLVGTGTPPKQPNATTITPVTVTSSVAVTARPTVIYASVPQPILPVQPPTTNFPTTTTTVFPVSTDRDNDIEVLREIESDYDSSYATVNNSGNGCRSQGTSPQHFLFPRQTAEPKRVGVGLRPAVGGGSGGGWSSLEERRLSLEERRLQLEERRLKLEERRVQHEEWRATMERESHEVDMDMKRALLKHMRQNESN